MRPIYHQKPERAKAHVFVASLAFLLDRALEKKLKSAAIDISSKEAWQILRTVRVVEIDLGGGEWKRSVTQGSARAARIVRALGITNRDPNTKAKPADRAATSMKKPVWCAPMASLRRRAVNWPRTRLPLIRRNT